MKKISTLEEITEETNNHKFSLWEKSKHFLSKGLFTAGVLGMLAFSTCGDNTTENNKCIGEDCVNVETVITDKNGKARFEDQTIHVMDVYNRNLEGVKVYQLEKKDKLYLAIPNNQNNNYGDDYYPNWGFVRKNPFLKTDDSLTTKFEPLTIAITLFIAKEIFNVYKNNIDISQREFLGEDKNFNRYCMTLEQIEKEIIEMPIGMINIAETMATGGVSELAEGELISVSTKASLIRMFETYIFQKYGKFDSYEVWVPKTTMSACNELEGTICNLSDKELQKIWDNADAPIWQLRGPCSLNNPVDGDIERCVNICNLSDTQCTDNTVEICLENSEGCTVWEYDYACATNQTCQNGSCVDNITCTDRCDLEDKKICLNNTMYKCGKTPEGCTDWVVDYNCHADEICEEGRCVPNEIYRECYLDEKKCRGNIVEGCKFGDDGFTHWVYDHLCNDNETCQEGICVDNSCTDECTINTKRCAGNTVEKCVRGTDGCTDWQDYQNCTANQTCQSGSCVDNTTCTDECTINTKRCDGNTVEKCVQGTDGCTDWQDYQNCTANQICSEGQCENDRFQDLGNGTVKDTTTNRIWQKGTSSTGLSFQDGLDYCENLTLGGSSNWGNPKIDELRTLIVGCSASALGGTCNISESDCTNYWGCRDASCDGCTLGAGPDGCYISSKFTNRCYEVWSSTDESDGRNAWIVNFNNAKVGAGNKTSTELVRCIQKNKK